MVRIRILVCLIYTYEARGLSGPESTTFGLQNELQNACPGPPRQTRKTCKKPWPETLKNQLENYSKDEEHFLILSNSRYISDYLF